ncbi:MAG: cytochrome P450 [Anaerolineae bacterium]
MRTDTTIEETQTKSAACPYHGSNQITGDHVELLDKPIEKDSSGVWRVRSYEVAKTLLRGNGLKQAGFQAEVLGEMRLGKDPMLYLEGAEHLALRKQTARFFTPKAVKAYDGMIGRMVDQMLADLREAGRVDLSQLTMKLATRVAAEVVGLTDSDIDGLSRRLGAFFDIRPAAKSDRKVTFDAIRHVSIAQFFMARFYFRDVRPAIRNRRKERQDDLISYLIDQEYTATQILTECLLFGAAGMVTTREFITAAALHFLRNEDMRADYLAADHAKRHEMLHEILRLEPVVGNLLRRTTQPIEVEVDGEKVEIGQGELIDMSVYGINQDAKAFGESAELVCPHRDLPKGVQVPGMSFGDGNHRCPGAFIAIEESDIFLTRFLKMDGLRLEQEPIVGRNEIVDGYEFKNFIVSVS